VLILLIVMATGAMRAELARGIGSVNRPIASNRFLSLVAPRSFTLTQIATPFSVRRGCV
jgi:hypothetical protein